VTLLYDLTMPSWTQCAAPVTMPSWTQCAAPGRTLGWRGWRGWHEDTGRENESMRAVGVLRRKRWQNRNCVVYKIPKHPMGPLAPRPAQSHQPFHVLHAHSTSPAARSIIPISYMLQIERITSSSLATTIKAHMTPHRRARCRVLCAVATCL